MEIKYNISKHTNGRWMPIAFFDKSIGVDMIVDCGYSIALGVHDADDVALVYAETGEVLWKATGYWSQELFDQINKERAKKN